MRGNHVRITSQRHILTTFVKRVKTESSLNPSTKRLTASQMKQQQTENDMNGLGKWKDYQRYKRLSNISLILIGIKVFLCFIYYEFDHMPSINTDWLLAFSFGLHCYLVAIRLVIEKIRNQRMQVIQKVSYNYHWQIFKILVSLPIYPMPWFHHTTIDANYSVTAGHQASYPFKVNYIIIIPALIESILVLIQTLIKNTLYYTPRAQRIGTIYQIQQYGELFAINCILKDHPYSAFGFVSITMLLLSAFFMKIFESDVPNDGNFFIHYENCFWFVCITITTVGYGDIYPVSDFGHVMVCFCCIWSTFNTSVVTFMLINNFTLNLREQKSLQILKNVDSTIQRKRLSSQYIRLAAYRLWLNKKYKFNYKQSLAEKKLRITLRQLRIDRKNACFLIDVAEQMKRQFANAQINVGILTQNTRNLMDYIANNYFVNSKVMILKPALITNSNFFKKAKTDEEQSEKGNISIARNIKKQKKVKIDKQKNQTNDNQDLQSKKQQFKLKQKILKSNNGLKTQKSRFAAIHAQQPA